jgi:AcrR family transcriptional regulator
MKTQAEDRRSKRTRQTLIHALIELLGSKHYDQITVQDIVDCANVGRSTFYAHFEDKDQLLKGGFESLLDTLVEHLSLDEATGGLSFDVSMLFQHAQGHFNLYRALIWGSGFDVITIGGHAALSEKIAQRMSQLTRGEDPASVPLPVLAYSVAGSLLILLKWWLDNKMPYPPEQMNEFFQELVMHAVRRSLRSSSS